MIHNIYALYYKTPTDIDWQDTGMVPGTGSLSIDTNFSKDGPVRTYKLDASMKRIRLEGPTYLLGDLRLMAVLDNGSRIQLGTVEMPVRPEVSGGNPLRVSCNWQDTI